MSEDIRSRRSRTSAVDKNETSKENSHRRSRSERRKRSHSRSRSRSPKEKSIKKSEVDHDIPDRSYGDLFCRACDCHMNGQPMWEAHIQGKRHIKNTKSGGPVDTKHAYLDEDPIIKPEIDADTRLLVGLDHICEFQRLEQMPIYSCFLCSATLPNYQRLAEHILGLKHRLAYLKEHDVSQHETILNSQLRKCHLESIVEECITTHVKNHGRGKMIVKREKNKTAFTPFKKGHSYDRDSHSEHPRNEHTRRERSPEWKKISSSNSKYYERERHSPKRRSDSNIDQYYRQEESRPTYYRTSTVKERSPPIVKKNDSESRRGVLESRSAYYQMSPVKEPSPPIVKKSDSGSRRGVLESRSAYYQMSPVKEPSPPIVKKSDSTSSRVWADETSRLGIPEGLESIDLRKILEQKKGFGIHSALENVASTAGRTATFPALENNVASATGSTAIAPPVVLPPSSITSISESMLQFINDLTPEMFFHLALFKLDNMEIQEEKIIKLLDRLIHRATALSCDIKTNKIFPSLQAKFHESMAQNGILPQSNSDFTQNMENLIQHYKSQKSFDESRLNQYQNSGVPDRNNLLAPQSNLSCLPTNSNSNNFSRYFSAPTETSTVSTTSFEYHHSTQSCVPEPFKGFSSTPSSIPGLTLTEEIIPQPAQPLTHTYPLRSPFEQLAVHAKNILGDLKMPLRNEYR